MKYFNHDTDAHRGQAQQKLMDEFKHAGPACYWIIHEMCAEKLSQTIEYREVKTLDAEGKEFITNEPYFSCKFTFHVTLVTRTLRVGVTKLSRILHFCDTLGLFSFQMDDKLVKFFFPKLLERLPSKTKTRLLEAAVRNQKGSLDKIREEKIREEESIRKRYALAFNVFGKNFPNTPAGSGAQKLFGSFVPAEQDQFFIDSIGHYAEFLKKNQWREPKQSFKSFIGGEGEEAFWRSFIAPSLNLKHLSVVTGGVSLDDVAFDPPNAKAETEAQS